MRTTASASSGYSETGLHSCPGNRLFNVVTQPVCRLLHDVVENAFVCKTKFVDKVSCCASAFLPSLSSSRHFFFSSSLLLLPFSLRLPLLLSLFIYSNSTAYPTLMTASGLVVRVLGCRSGGPGSIPGTTRKKSNGSGTGSTQPREYN
jgi:hypothetical protein